VRILLIESHMPSGNIDETLRRAGLTVCATCRSEDGVELARLYDHDLIVLDQAWPEAKQILREIRGAGVLTPILMLSDDDDVETKLECFRLGGDDCLSRRFDADELVARVHAIARRYRGHAHSVIRAGRLAVNVSNGTVTANGMSIQLTRKEFQVLEVLALRKGAIVSTDMFLDHLYGGTDEPETKVLPQLICRLRRKIAGALGDAEYIETVPGRGYMLREPAEAREPNRVASQEIRTSRYPRHNFRKSGSSFEAIQEAA
jgi:two-component system, cell cycle response regulator CtrA